MPVHQSSLADLSLPDRKFHSKERIKPWLQRFLLARKGINIVIERSDSNKIIFRCKPQKRDNEGESHRRSTCPFRVRANYSSRNRYWSLVVINEWHDHDLEPQGLILMLPMGLEMFEDEAVRKEPASKTSTPKSRLRDGSGSYKVFSSSVTEPENKQQQLILQLLTNEVNTLVREAVVENRSLSEQDKSSILRGFSSQFVLEYKHLISPAAKTSGLSSWLSTPNQGHSTLNHNPSANLIPLTPLLNESDQDYTDTEAESAPHTSLDNFTHLPGLNLNFNSNTIQLPLLIQNHAQQLPSFNSIQNQLPFSPTISNFPTHTSGSSNTLNPSHLHNSKSSSNLVLGPSDYRVAGPSSSPAANASTNTFASSFPQSSSTLGPFTTQTNASVGLSLPGAVPNTGTHSVYRDLLASFAHSANQQPHGLASISDW